MTLRGLLLSIGLTVVSHALAIPILKHSSHVSGSIILCGFASSYWPALHGYPLNLVEMVLVTGGWLLIAWLGCYSWLRLRGRAAAWFPIVIMIGLWLTWGVLLGITYAA